MKKRINSLIRTEILSYLNTHNGAPTKDVIDFAMTILPTVTTSNMHVYITRQRMAGNISALVTKFMAVKCISSCLYI
ncbi:hypothetical protein [Anaerosporobacter sp.]